MMDRFLDRIAQLGRKKPLEELDDDHKLDSPLTRNLTTFNILFLCLGETLGFGIFLVNGYVSKELAGPGTVFSFIFAAIIAIIPAACYVEFGAKIPRSGSAYDYVYTTVGELVAFSVGWNLVLEFIVRAVSMAQMCSGTIDQLTGNTIKNFTVETFQGGEPWDYTHVVEYPDVIASLCVIGAIAIVKVGAKRTAQLVTTLLICKYVVVCFTIYIGIVNIGGDSFEFRDGLLPHGITGIIRGILPCFFAFTAFNALGTTGGETKNPRKSIPLSAICFMLVSIFTFVINALSLNLTVPESAIRSGEAYFETFSESNYEWGKYFIGIGAVCTYFSSTIVNIFFVSRLFLAISEDGLIMHIVDHDTLKKRRMDRETFWFSIIVAATTMFIKFKAFEQFQSAGIVCSLIVVCLGVILLRYTPYETHPRRREGETTDEDAELFVKVFRDVKKKNEKKRHKQGAGHQTGQTDSKRDLIGGDTSQEEDDDGGATASWLDSSELALMSEEAGMDETPLESELARLLPSSEEEGDPSSMQLRSEGQGSEEDGQESTTKFIPGTLSMRAHPVFHPLAKFPPTSVVATCLMTSLAFQIGYAAIVSSTSFSFVSKGKLWALLQVLLLALSLASLIPIYLHHKRLPQKGTYEVPAVPTLPLISIFINIHFLFQLPGTTWIRSLIWMVVGFFIYATYGYSHSAHSYQRRWGLPDATYRVDCRRAMPSKHTYKTVPTYQQLERNAVQDAKHRL